MKFYAVPINNIFVFYQAVTEEKKELKDTVKPMPDEKPRFTIRKEDGDVPSEDDDNDIKDDAESMDIDEALKKEIAELKSDRVRKRFQCVDTGVNNVVFISSTVG